MTLLEQLLRERYPTASEVEAERQHPVPPYPIRKGGSGLTHFETLLAQARRAS